MTQPAAQTFTPHADDLARLGKSGDRHKYDYGHAVILSGPPGQGGAARLAARGALRVGAGLVSVVCGPDSLSEHAAHLNAIMVKPHADDNAMADHLTALKPGALCIGPNFGTGPDRKVVLVEALSLDLLACLDADALTLIAQDPVAFKQLASSRIVLTPHAGELRRLIPEAYAVEPSRQRLAQIAAQTYGCTVLFKGADTIIAQPDRPSVIVTSTPVRHAPWLATAGSGDVLSGIITGLLARGFDTGKAAALGAYLHLQCADEAGIGLIAEDLPEALPAVLTRLLHAD